MTSGLQRRLFLLLLVPLLLLVSINIWFDFRLADSAALQHDRQLSGLLPLLADSVVSRGTAPNDPPVLLMAPPVNEFLQERSGLSGFAVLDTEGQLLLGESWLKRLPPTTNEVEFSSEEYEGSTYRIASQRVKTAAGEMLVRLADGSDTRQQWVRRLWRNVVFPNLVLVVVAFLAVKWAVTRALQPLFALKQAVESRSPRDLSALDPLDSPDEVRPLVLSLNRLFDLVNAQAESQRRFVADAAHQLRTPLAALQSQVEAWAMVVENRKKHQNKDPALVGVADDAITLGASQVLHLRQAVRRTSLLANQLLALSRVDARSATSQPTQRVDLKALCEVVLETHLDAANRKGLDLGLDAAPAHVTGYEWLLRELLVNVLDNAIAYTPAGGHVTVRCGTRDAGGGGGGGERPIAFLEVEDDGPGVAPLERARMLERFYRIPGTPGEGNGLGLAIAQEIASLHHSRLRVKSGRDGLGLRVSLDLPD